MRAMKIVRYCRMIFIRYCWLLFVLFATIAFGGNTPCAPTVLSGSDMFSTYTTAGNSGSSIAPPPCGMYSGIDFWFEVTIGPTGTLYIVSTDNEITNGALAIYSGDCSNPMLLDCVEDDRCGMTPMPITTLYNQTPGSTLLIRFWAESSSPQGTFDFYASETSPSAPLFNLIGDAAYSTNDCISLTANQPSNQGCAWLPTQVDFSQPFSHVMSANFGSIDANGADGICLTYQANNDMICGNIGEGIGSQGIPNSLIIEFDTWQNGALGDPFNDHVAINLNGNMDHAASIAGPIDMGNIEDGMFHDIEFTWDPTTMEFILRYDGTILVQMNYDIINNAFGGNSLAYWGYTSSTGAATNEHIICPDVPLYVHGSLDTVEVEICEGQSHFAGGAPQSQSGIYTDIFPNAVGCDSTILTVLTVLPMPSSTIDTVLCIGDCIVVGTQTLCSATSETITIPTVNCDSAVNITIDVLNPFARITGMDNLLTCETTSILLDGTSSTGGDSLSYSWQGPNGYMADSAQINVLVPGTYLLEVTAWKGDVMCTSEQAVYQVFIDTLAPVAIAGDDIAVGCGTIDTFLSALGSNVGPPFTLQWNYQGGYYSDEFMPSISAAGVYELIIVNSVTGCTSSDTVIVFPPASVPSVTASGGTLTCDTTERSLSVDSIFMGGNYSWTGPNSFTSDSLQPGVSMPGVYTLRIELPDGCIISDTALVSIDTIHPTMHIYGVDTLSCAAPTSLLTSLNNVERDVFWIDPLGNTTMDTSIVASFDGRYRLVGINRDNGCRDTAAIDLLTIDTLPQFSLATDTITCIDTSVLVRVTANASGYGYDWIGPNGFNSINEDISVNIPGTYVVEVTGTTGCTITDSIQVAIDTVSPVVSILPDTLTCAKTSIVLSTSSSDTAWSYQWVGPNFQSTASTPEVNSPGRYDVTITNTNGCESMADVTIEIDTQRLSISFSPWDTLDCRMDSVTINALTSVDSDVFWIDTNGDSIYSSSLTTNIAGEYQYVAINSNGCLSSEQLTILEERDTADVDLYIDTLSCLQTEIEIGATEIDDLSYQWQGPENTTSMNASFVTSLPGIYRLTVTASNNCTSTYEVLIPIDSIHPTVEVQDIQLSCPINATYTIQPSFSQYRYSWTGPNGFSAIGAEIEIASPGSYAVDVLDTINGCRSTAMLIATAPPLPSIENYNLQVPNCIEAGSISEVLVEGGTQPYSFALNNGATQIENNFLNLNPGNYLLQVIDSLNCTDEIQITIPAFSPIGANMALTYNLGIGDTISLNPDITPSATIIDSISWSDSAAFSCTNCLQPNFFPSSSGTFTLFVRDTNGCVDQLQFTVTIADEKFYIPNSFSPNNDGINDFFTIYSRTNSSATIEKFAIFNRWGDKVFERIDTPTNAPQLRWDGTYKDQRLDPDIFVYLIKVRLQSGAERLFKGEIHLIK